MWRGWVATGRSAEYVEYITETGLAEYRQTPGNVDAHYTLAAWLMEILADEVTVERGAPPGVSGTTVVLRRRARRPR